MGTHRIDLIKIPIQMGYSDEIFFILNTGSNSWTESLILKLCFFFILQETSKTRLVQRPTKMSTRNSVYA